MSITETVNDLRDRLAQARERVNALAAERQPYAFAAKTGDAVAQAALDEITDKQRLAALDVGDLDLALTEAERRLAEEAKEARDRAADLALAEAVKLREELLAESRAVDNAARLMVAALKRRAHLRTRLVRSGCLDPNVGNRLQSPTRLNRALVVAGLGEFAELPRHSATELGRTLTEDDAQNLSALRRPGPATTAGTLVPPVVGIGSAEIRLIASGVGIAGEARAHQGDQQ